MYGQIGTQSLDGVTEYAILRRQASGAQSADARIALRESFMATGHEAGGFDFGLLSTVIETRDWKEADQQVRQAGTRIADLSNHLTMTQCALLFENLLLSDAFESAAAVFTAETAVGGVLSKLQYSKGDEWACKVAQDMLRAAPDAEAVRACERIGSFFDGLERIGPTPLMRVDSASPPKVSRAIHHSPAECAKARAAGNAKPGWLAGLIQFLQELFAWCDRKLIALSRMGRAPAWESVPADAPVPKPVVRVSTVS